MNTLYFKYALEIGRTGSITRAAENLYIAQPNLSKAVKELENTLGFSIFRRTSKGMVATPKGEEFLRHAGRIVGQLSEIEALRGETAANESFFHVAVPAAGYISAGIASFLAATELPKKTDILIRETNALHAIDEVAENGFSFAVVRYSVAYEKYFSDFLAEKNMRAELLWEFAPVVLLHKEHPLSGKSLLSPAELADYPEASCEELLVPYVHAEPKNTEQQKPIRLYSREGGLSLLKAMPRAYMLSTPEDAALLEAYGLVQRQRESTERRRDVLVSLKTKRYSSFEAGLIDALYAAKNKILFS